MTDSYHGYKDRYGVYCDQSDPNVTFSILRDNGHGLYADNNSAPRLDRCLIENNNDDGIYARDNSAPLLYECLIEANVIHCRDWNYMNRL